MRCSLLFPTQILLLMLSQDASFGQNIHKVCVHVLGGAGGWVVPVGGWMAHGPCTNIYRCVLVLLVARFYSSFGQNIHKVCSGCCGGGGRVTGLAYACWIDAGSDQGCILGAGPGREQVAQGQGQAANGLPAHTFPHTCCLPLCSPSPPPCPLQVVLP